MPVYVYRVQGEKLEATHRMSADPRNWGELCAVAGLDPARYPADEPVERLIVPVAGRVNEFTADLKNSGFQRLERRDKGVYENVTAPKGEQRFINANE